MKNYVIGEDIITGRDKRLDKKTGKYKYEIILQGNYGTGWDDLTSYDCDSTGWIKDTDQRKQKKDDFKAYRDNEPQYQHRIITRRIKI